MTNRPTVDESLQRQEEGAFVGREEERRAFRRDFESEAPETRVFFVHGPAGVGKSSLTARYRAIAREHDAATALADDAETTAIREQSILQAMARLSHDLAEAGAPLDAFDKGYARYRERMREIDADPHAPQDVFDRLKRPTAWPEERAGAWAAYLARKLETRDEAALVAEPVATLTPLFVAGVNEHAASRPILLCFDDWEQTGAHLGAWLRSLLAPGGLCPRVRLVVAGQDPPGDEWEPFRPAMASLELRAFTEAETRGYLQAQGIDEETRVAQILSFSDGVPVLVSVLASARGDSPAPPARDLVSRYLSWIDDPRRRIAVLFCAVARRLDPDVVRAQVGGLDAGQEAGSLFDWLIQTPLVRRRPGYWAYHPLVRGLLLRYAHQAPQGSQRLHGVLATYYAGLLVEMDPALGYHDETWQRRRLEMLYHELLRGDATAIRNGLDLFVLMLRGSYRLAGEVAATWRQAADEPGAGDEVTRWARVVSDGWAALEASAWADVARFCEALEQADLSDRARCEGYFVGGLARAAGQDYAGAAAAFDRVVDLDPGTAPAYVNRGLARVHLGDHERAIADFGRVVDLDPGNASAYYHRGLARTRLEDYAGAVADFSRAVDLDPRDARAYYNRGGAYLRLQDHERAIADYTQVIALTPGDARAYANRGLARARSRDHAGAIADLDRAVALDPRDATAYYNRGLARARLQDREGAIADYTRAIDLNPRDALAYANRGLARHELGDYDRALADLERAIALNPGYAKAYYNAACAYARRGETEAAVARLEQAIGLNERWREWARKDADFEGIRGDGRFQELVETEANSKSQTPNSKSQVSSPQ